MNCHQFPMKAIRLRKIQTCGFSFVEILVVIVVIAILLALLLPALTGAKEGSKKTSCLASLTQVSEAMTLYADENNQAFPLIVQGTFKDPLQPTAMIFMDTVGPYLASNAVRCLEVPRYPNIKASLNTGYCMNTDLNMRVIEGQKVPLNHYTSYTLSDVPYATTTVLIPECSTGAIAVASPEMIAVDVSVQSIWDEYSNNETPGSLRHNNGSEFAFIDGHIKWYPSTEYPTGTATESAPGFGIGQPRSQFLK